MENSLKKSVNKNLSYVSVASWIGFKIEHDILRTLEILTLLKENPIEKRESKSIRK